MSNEEIVGFLTERGHGVLSLAADSVGYGIPVSFGYAEEEEAIYLYLNQFGDESRKLDILTETEGATLVAYEVESRDRWRSVVVTGHLADIDGSSTTEQANEMYVDEVMKDNAWFPVFPEEGEQITESNRYLFVIDEMAGRQGDGYL